MPLWLQHLLVLAAVAGAAVFLVRQAVATFRVGKGGFGSCCAKGCPPAAKSSVAGQPAEKIVFLPADSLSRRRR